MPSDELVARRQALEEKRRRIEALRAQKAERARQAATSQKSAASAAANLRSYVDGLLSQKSEAPAPAAPVSTPNGTQLPPPPPPAASRASTSPRYERKIVDVLAAATQPETHEDGDEDAAASNVRVGCRVLVDIAVVEGRCCQRIDVHTSSSIFCASVR